MSGSEKARVMGFHCFTIKYEYLFEWLKSVGPFVITQFHQLKYASIIDRHKAVAFCSLTVN